MTLYAITIFLSAFLLFQVQPLIAKIILPWFGGSAAVWSAAMLFFQISLLAGYAYAHFLIGRFNAKRQMQVHGALLALSLCAAADPAESGLEADPSRRSHAADPAGFGGLDRPALFSVVLYQPSATGLVCAPHPARKMPYRLFALSNFGSMLGLISFPFLVEPKLASRVQAYSWSGVYVAFALLCGFAAWISRAELTSSQADPDRRSHASTCGLSAPDAAELLLWVGLAACASARWSPSPIISARTSRPIPLLWVIPLALYLLSFILCFESDKIYQRWMFVPAVGGAAGLHAALHLFGLRKHAHQDHHSVVRRRSVRRLHGLPRRAVQTQTRAAAPDAVLSDGEFGRSCRGHCS